MRNQEQKLLSILYSIPNPVNGANDTSFIWFPLTKHLITNKIPADRCRNHETDIFKNSFNLWMIVDWNNLGGWS